MNQCFSSLPSFKNLCSNSNRMFFLLLLYQRESNKSKKHSLYLKQYYRRLDAQCQCLQQRQILNNALHHPSCSAWQKLQNSQDNQAFITLTWIYCEPFLWLVGKFQPVFDFYLSWVTEDGYITPVQQGMGCPRLIDAAACLVSVSPGRVQEDPTWLCN
jgi:hypothetical protein